MRKDRREIDPQNPEEAGLRQRERKHPDEYEADLNPSRMAGQDIGNTGDELPNAYDRKDVHNSLSGFADDELKSIPIVPEGERLQQGATYLDLNDRDREEFTATGEMAAAAGERIVPKGEVPYPLWNRLRGVDDPNRTQ